MLDWKFDIAKRPRRLRGVNTDVPIKPFEHMAHDTAPGEEVITLSHIKKAYPNGTPLLDVNAAIMQGDVVTIIGPSGTGKSTMMRIINGLEKQTEGTITIFGQDISEKSAKTTAVLHRTGFVFQSFNLFSHLTVVENIMLAPVHVGHMPRQQAYELAMSLLDRVGLVRQAFSYPGEISGGQKQRVAIARTLAMDPDIVFFDEPTSALDPTMVGEVLSVIRGLAAQGLTMMIVTHEMKFARDVSTRIFYMDQGLIYEQGTPDEIFDHPQKPNTRQFIKRLRFFDREIRSRHFDYPQLFTDIEVFGRKQNLSQRVIDNMNHLVEELCLQSILPALGDDPLIMIHIEFSDLTGQTTVTISYNGDATNLLDTLDDLPRAIITHAASELTYTHDDLNHITAVVNG